MSMLIRPERAEDVLAISDVVRAAFADAAHCSGSEAAIVDALRAAGAMTLSLVAAEGSEIFGHVAVSPVVSEGAVGKWFGLGPVSVRPDRQRRGIGSALVGEALARLRGSGAVGCVVLGEPGYYGRFGFEHDPAVHYRDVPPPYFQLISFNGERLAGAVEYHRAFETAG